jgi:hypothetical protein
LHGAKKRPTKNGMDEVPFVCVFDLETDDKISNSLGRNRVEQVKNLQFTCCSCLCVSADAIARLDPPRALIEGGTMQTYWRDNQTDIDNMIKMFDDATTIVGYNLCGFDWFVLRKHYRDKVQFHAHLSKTLDVFSRIRDVACHWPTLDSLLKRNGLSTKLADGLAAIQMYSDGRLDELKAYCEGDVRSCAHLALLDVLLVDVPGVGTITIPGHVFNVQTALQVSIGRVRL